MNSAYSFVYTVIHYTCGHSVIRRILRHQAGTPERWSLSRCCHCTDQLARRYAVVRAVQEEREEGLPKEGLPVFTGCEWPPVAREVEVESRAI